MGLPRGRGKKKSLLFLSLTLTAHDVDDVIIIEYVLNLILVTIVDFRDVNTDTTI